MPLFNAIGTPTLTMLTATSAIKTPTGSGNYLSMTSNSVTLVTGATYEISASGQFLDNGTSAAYTGMLIGIFGANGADSSAIPTLMTATSNLTVNSVHVPYVFYNFTTNGWIATPLYVVTTTAAVTLFSVPYATLGVTANSRITSFLSARRIY